MRGDWAFNCSNQQIVPWGCLYLSGITGCTREEIVCSCVTEGDSAKVLIWVSVSEGDLFGGSGEVTWPFQLQSQPFSMMLLYKCLCSSKEKRGVIIWPQDEAWIYFSDLAFIIIIIIITLLLLLWLSPSREELEKGDRRGEGKVIRGRTTRV